MVPSSSNMSYIALQGLVLLLSNWIVSKFHYSNVIILRCLKKGNLAGSNWGQKGFFYLPLQQLLVLW